MLSCLRWSKSGISDSVYACAMCTVHTVHPLGIEAVMKLGCMLGVQCTIRLPYFEIREKLVNSNQNTK